MITIPIITINYYYHCHYCYLSHNLSLNLKLTGFQALGTQSQILLLHQASRLPRQHYSYVKFCQLPTLSRLIRKLMSGQNSLNCEVKISTTAGNA